MGRLLMAGALACVAVLAQEKNDNQKSEDRSQKSEELLTKPLFRLPNPVANNGSRPLIVNSRSWNCIAPMPGAKPVNVDPEIVVPPAERTYGMPVVAPPPICGQQSANEPKK